MKVIVYGRQQAGMIYLLLILALGHKIVCVIPEDEIMERASKKLKLNIKKPKDINSKEFYKYLKTLKPDLFLSVQGMKIIGKDILSIGGMNVHACLSSYPGDNPIERLLKDKGEVASVGIHWMTDEVDGGPIIDERFMKITGKTESEVYNELYLLYVEMFVDIFYDYKRIKQV